jgi:hypothetical protein
MLRALFLRRHAEFLLDLSRTCSDPPKVASLRLVAADFLRRADDAEAVDAPHDMPTGPAPEFRTGAAGTD